MPKPDRPMARAGFSAESDVGGPWPPSFGLERRWLLSVRAAILQRLVTSWQPPSAFWTAGGPRRARGQSFGPATAGIAFL